jgi:transcriptional regulator with GAF, ATPase, and Fis domain
LVAAELVRTSDRKKGPFVVVDCGAIPANLIESELFGHAKGAFTGAHQVRVGAFEAAHGGTIFLDEIGELPVEIQPKLLRVLAQKEIRRLGENHPREVDVRVIAATNRDLEREVNEGRFREDLYYRLAVVNLNVPPLRERAEDIPLLVQHFLSEMEELDKMSLFSKETLAKMAKHRWPGNIRELRNYVERIVYAGPDLEGPVTEKRNQLPADEVDIELPYKAAKRLIVDRFEEAYCQKLIAWANGNMSKAARKAELDRMYIKRMALRHGIVPKRSKAAPSS